MAQGKDAAAAGLQAGFRRGAAGLEVRPQLTATPEGSADTADIYAGGKGSKQFVWAAGAVLRLALVSGGSVPC